MKKLLVSLLMILLALPFCTVYAAEAVSFSADNVTCKNNRLIDININAMCDKKLSAAIFEFTFDKSILEFRGAKAPDDSKVVFNEKTDCVKLSYLCTYGADIMSSAPIFTLKFKSIGEGSTDIGFKVYDCVDADVQHMSVGVCTAGSVTVTAKARDNVGTIEATQSTSAEMTTQGDIVKTQPSPIIEAESTVLPPKADSGLRTDFPQSGSQKWIPLLVLCLSVIAAVMFARFAVFKFKKDKKNSSED